MSKEILGAFSYLSSFEEPFFVDGTLGLAGHSTAIAKALKVKNKRLTIIGIDKDREAIEIAEREIRSKKLEENFIFVHDDFHNMKSILSDLNIKSVGGVLLDLGISSMQLDNKNRGFSFLDSNMPLDMRMDTSQPIDAAFIVNNYSQKELNRVLRDGEERYWRKVSTNICRYRKTKEIKNSGELIKILAKSLPKVNSKTHFATDTFRALRLEVNNEIRPLKKTINDMIDALSPKGKLAVITFHSIEDRIVKNEYKLLANPCTCPPQLPKCVCGKTPKIKIITKKPIVPNEVEIDVNPRARSAKLRIAQRI